MKDWEVKLLMVLSSSDSIRTPVWMYFAISSLSKSYSSILSVLYSFSHPSFLPPSLPLSLPPPLSVSFISEKYGVSVLTPLKVLVQHLCTKVPDRAEYRNRLAPVSLALISSFILPLPLIFAFSPSPSPPPLCGESEGEAVNDRERDGWIKEGGDKMDERKGKLRELKE